MDYPAERMGRAGETGGIVRRNVRRMSASPSGGMASRRLSSGNNGFCVLNAHGRVLFVAGRGMAPCPPVPWRNPNLGRGIDYKGLAPGLRRTEVLASWAVGKEWFMFNDKQELDEMKTKIDLRQYAAGQGYQLDPKGSWRGTAVMRHSATHDKVIIKRDTDGHYVYFSVRDDRDNGTILDFVMQRHRVNFGMVEKS